MRGAKQGFEMNLFASKKELEKMDYKGNTKDLRMWPALETMEKIVIEECKAELQRKIRHPEEKGAGKLANSIRRLWAEKKQLMIKVGPDPNMAKNKKGKPYAEFVEAGHYYSIQFCENNWTMDAKYLKWDTDSKKNVWKTRPPHKSGYWFMRNGTKNAIKRGQPYIAESIVQMAFYRVGPRGGVYDRPYTGGGGSGELKRYRST